MMGDDLISEVKEKKQLRLKVAENKESSTNSLGQLMGEWKRQYYNM